MVTLVSCVGTEVLDLSQTNVSDTDVIEAVKRLPNLVQLSCSNCNKISEDLPMLLYHTYAPYHCIAPMLESLNVNRCFQLTDTAIMRTLQWSITKEYALKAASFGKMTITTLNAQILTQRLLQSFHEMQGTQDFVDSDILLKTPVRWSTLRILCLNNVERVGLSLLNLISLCCPNLAVLGLGGTLLEADLVRRLDTPFGVACGKMIEHLDLKRYVSFGPLVATVLFGFATASLCAMVASMPRLWLLELTFFPTSVINQIKQTLASDVLPLTPQQRKTFHIVDFANAQSIIEFQTCIVDSYKRMLEARTNNAAFRNSDLLWRFEDFPTSFLDLLIATASNTSKGGSLIGPLSSFTFSSTPLHCAAENGDVALVRALIKFGVELEVRGRGSGSPLFKVGHA